MFYWFNNHRRYRDIEDFGQKDEKKQLSSRFNLFRRRILITKE